MIDEDVTTAFCGFAAMLFFALLLTMVFRCWIRQHDIHLPEQILKFLHRPIGEVLIVLVCVGGMVQHGATKGLLGGPRMTSPREMRAELASVPEPLDVTAGIFPPYTNAVTNVCATGIMPAETSVFLRAHWPWDIYPAPAGIEVYAAPRLSTNEWVGVGMAPMVGRNSSMVIELPYSLLPEGWTNMMFFKLGLNVDTDGDGLSDAFERIVSKTDPTIIDTDGDGMPDGWEYNNGFNAHSNPTDDEANADADGDGLDNVEEWRARTDPNNPDTDGDGLEDGKELGSVRRAQDFVWYDTSDGENLLAGLAYETCYEVWSRDLAYPVNIGTQTFSRMTIDLNGALYLIPPGGEDVAWSDVGSDLRYWREYDRTNVVVGAYWESLYALPSLGSSIRICSVPSNRCTVVEWRHMARDDWGEGTNDWVTFQAVLPSGTSDVVQVNYLAATPGFLANTYPVIGVLDSSRINYAEVNGNYYLQFSHGAANAVVPPQTVAFRLGTGTDPLNADTDGDGLPDLEELNVSCTAPLKSDTDGDGLPDKWELDHGFDPLSTDGDDGRDGDPDGDGLPNLGECAHGTDPREPDTDDDGLSDGEEAGGVTVTNALPWLAFDEGTVTDLTHAFPGSSCSLAQWTLPVTLVVQGVMVTNVVLDVSGVLYLVRAGCSGPDWSRGPSDLSRYVVQDDALLIAPYWSYLSIEPELSTRIRAGTATHDGVGYLLVEYENVCQSLYWDETNAVSFQVAIPTNGADRAYVRYRDVMGSETDGRYASVGFQSFDGHMRASYCYRDDGRICDGLAMRFLFGAGSDPLNPDTDGDGLSDSREAALGTDLNLSDTDGDSLPDGWEVGYGLDPLSASGDDGADGDFDGDGLLNADEHSSGTDPARADTDGDGLSDLVELGGVTTNALPWLQFETQTNLTASFEHANGSVVTWPIPEPIYLHGVCVTEVTVDSNGLVYFNRKGTRRTWSAGGGSRMTDSWTVNADSFTVAPYWDYLYLTEETPATVISAGTATSGTNRFFVIQYDGVCPYDNRMRHGVTNSVSWQLAVPYGDADRMYVRYSNQIGTTDGGEASVGCQDFNGGRKVSYCYREAGKVFDGLAFAFAVGTNTDPLDADTYGSGSGDASVYQSQIDPSRHDADGDGLSDAEERARGTEFMNADTDGDGMADGWEVCYGFDPCVAAEADGDPDDDGLANIAESRLGSDPRSVDTDGDGLDDGDEARRGADPTRIDTDRDGLDDGFEVANGLDPAQPDTDGDGLTDGWEFAHSSPVDPSLPAFDPRVDNALDGDPRNNADVDPDRDGLSNAEECMWGTDPNNPDTDDDGAKDGEETGAVPRPGGGAGSVSVGCGTPGFSDPADPTDGGVPGSRLKATLHFGDDSGSHSEKYRVELSCVDGGGTSFNRINLRYGECETLDLALKPGCAYEVRLYHAGTNGRGEGYPDYDYTLELWDKLAVLIVDPQGLFGSHGNDGSRFPGAGKVAKLYVPKLTVKGVKFNHDPASHTTDALNIRRNAGEAYDVSEGEWTEDGERNYPACYVGGAVPKVKVKFEIRPKTIASARISAGADDGFPLGNLSARTVSFVNGDSGWVDFDSAAVLERKVAKADGQWKWKVSKLGGIEVDEIELTRTGPHRVYVVPNAPVEPWRSSAGDRQCPWTVALELACTVADGLTDNKRIMAAITSHLFHNMGFVYETKEGRARYWDGLSFNLMNYLSKTSLTVNCYDQAYGVATFGNLLGVYSTPVFTQPFGYVNTTDLVGVGLCNNPFFTWSGAVYYTPICGVDDPLRTNFLNHMYVYAEGEIFDACCGPVLGGVTEAQYLRNTIDSSTETERVYSYFAPVGENKREFRSRSYKLWKKQK